MYYSPLSHSEFWTVDTIMIILNLIYLIYPNLKFVLSLPDSLIYQYYSFFKAHKNFV